MAIKATFREVEGFVNEAQGYLPTIRQQLAAYMPNEPAGGSPEALEAAFCHVQALRGAASMIGLKALARLASGLETTLGEVRHGAVELDGEARRRAFKTLDDIALALAGFRLQASRVVWSRTPKGKPADEPDDEAELVEIFRVEAEEHFLHLARFFGDLRLRPDDRSALREIQRRAHTLKGAAGTAGMDRVSRLAHRMEDLLDALLDGRLTPDAQRLRLMLRTTDALQALVYEDVEPGHLGPLLEELDASYRSQLGVPDPSAERWSAAPAPPASPMPDGRRAAPAGTEARSAAPAPAGALSLIRLPLDRFESLQRLVGELILNRGGLEQQVRDFQVEIEECEAGVGRLEHLAAWLEDEVTLGLPLPSRPAARSEPKTSGASSTEPDRSFDELELDRYTELDVMSRHLVEVAADLHTVAGDLRGLLRSLETAVKREKGLSRQLENRMTQARLVSFASLAPRLQRTARVTAARQAKLVELVIHGQEVEVDKMVLEELAAPLGHVVRNAVDHGIESPGERRAAGKREKGRLEITVAHHGRQVVIEVADDGRGLDTAAILRAAERAGLDRGGELARLNEREIASLIFVPGLSTARSVDEISGRGVGMDVVEATVHQLNGDVRVDSEPGRGARFTLRLPLSLASDRVLLVQAGARTYAVPQAYVEQVLAVPSEAVGRQGDAQVLRQGERTYPLVSLAEMLDAGAADVPLAGPTVTALVVEPGGLGLGSAGPHGLAIAVDALLGSREVVVKPLASHLRQVGGVIGATLLGGGSLVLILNPVELAAARQRPLAARPAVRRRAVAPSVTAPPSAAASILIVDDSLSVRRSVADSVTAAGWRPVTARDGQEALELLQQARTPPGAVVLDLEMPRMDGFELTSTLRAIPEYAGIPVIILTSRASEKHRRRALELGATDYLTKPYQEEILLRKIRAVLGPPESHA